MAIDVDTRSTTSLTDLGLLVLRLGVGATMLQAGLAKFFDFSAVAAGMESGRWRPAEIRDVHISATETAGGIGLLLGLLTPLAACAVIAAMIDAWAVNVAAGAFWSNPFNLPFMVAFGATALLCTGAGAYSMDERLWGRSRWPAPVVIGLFVIAVLAAVVTWVALNGTNPIHFTAPAA
jgi:putative oxidoreductase